MAEIEIKCIVVDGMKYENANNAEALHESITHLGGDGWRLSLSEVVEQIEETGNVYFVASPMPTAPSQMRGRRAEVGVVNGPNGKYLRAKLVDFGHEMYCDNLFGLGKRFENCGANSFTLGDCS